jgi:hypothetical protein
MSSSYKIYDIRNVDFSNITYGDPQKTRGNAYICSIEKDHDIVFQSGTLTLEEAIHQTEKECFIKVNVENTEMKKFITELDEYNINYIYQNSVKWFANEKLPLNQIRGFYKSNLKENQLTMSIPVIKKKIELRVYDEKKNLVPIEELSPESKVVLVWRLNGIKFFKKECVIDSDVIQILYIRQKPQILRSVEQDVSENTKQNQNNELLKRFQFRDELKLKKEKATQAFIEAEQARLHADELKSIASQLALEVKEMEDEYYKEEADDYDESEDDNQSQGN